MLTCGMTVLGLADVITVAVLRRIVCALVLDTGVETLAFVTTGSTDRNCSEVY
ncbi:hypothetical protein Hanom_Chr14g01256321 [Helianthus anomalus]